MSDKQPKPDTTDIAKKNAAAAIASQAVYDKLRQKYDKFPVPDLECPINGWLLQVIAHQDEQIDRLIERVCIITDALVACGVLGIANDKGEEITGEDILARIGPPDNGKGGE